MKCYVLELKQVTGNRVDETLHTNGCYYNAVPTYIAPKNGKYIWSQTVMANDIKEAAQYFRNQNHD